MVDRSDAVLMAEKDGIEYFVDPNRRNHQSWYVFKVPCEECGTKIEVRRYDREKNYKCEYCKRNLKKKQTAVKNAFLDAVFTKGERRLSSACEEMRKQFKNFDEDYKGCVAALQGKKELFDSIPEVMVALQLLKLGYKIIIHQKVRSYTVDLMIPAEKLVIEIDGEIYHKKGIDELRDEAIKYALGHEWKIIHIPAEMIRKKIKNVGMIIEKAKALL